MSMPVSEKNFLEKIAGLLPGLAGYREREGRRETDRRLREYLAGRLDEARVTLTALRRRLTDASQLTLLDDVGRLDAEIQKAAAGLRFSDYGYSGLFDQVKIREDELARIYEHDEALLGEVHDLAARLAAAAPTAESLDDLTRRAGALALRVARRRELFETPSSPAR